MSNVKPITDEDKRKALVKYGFSKGYVDSLSPKDLDYAYKANKGAN